MAAALTLVFVASLDVMAPSFSQARSAMESHQQQQVVHAVSRRRQQGAPLVADGGPRAPRRPRVVRSVDEDLYKVHPDLLPKKGKGVRRLTSLYSAPFFSICIAISYSNSSLFSDHRSTLDFESSICSLVQV